MGECAFDSCRSLESAFIGKGVQEVYASTFEYCQSLERIDVHDDNTFFKDEDGNRTRRKDMRQVLAWSFFDSRDMGAALIVQCGDGFRSAVRLYNDSALCLLCDAVDISDNVTGINNISGIGSGCFLSYCCNGSGQCYCC